MIYHVQSRKDHQVLPPSNYPELTFSTHHSIKVFRLMTYMAFHLYQESRTEETNVHISH